MSLITASSQRCIKEYFTFKQTSRYYCIHCIMYKLFKVFVDSLDNSDENGVTIGCTVSFTGKSWRGFFLLAMD